MLVSLPAAAVVGFAPLELLLLGILGPLVVVVAGTVAAALGNRRAGDPRDEPAEELLPR